jgi:hypothetical protein
MMSTLLGKGGARPSEEELERLSKLIAEARREGRR